MRPALHVCVVLAFACERPIYRYEQAPLSSPPRGPAEACYRRERVELAGGSVTWRTTDPGYTTDTVIVSFYRDSGVTVYRDGRRFDAMEALRRLGDPALDSGYASVLARTEGAHRAYPRWRIASLALALPATAAVVGGAIWWTVDGFESVTPAYVMLGGLVVGLISLAPTLGAYVTRDDYLSHERARVLFTDRDFVPRLVDGATRYNARVAAKCGHDPADLPMTPGVRAGLARPP